jgi:uncharacterized membrane protein YbhN (UPF0104 family)
VISGPARRRAVHVLAFVLTMVVAWALFTSLRRDGPAALEAWRNADVRWRFVLLATAFGLVGHAVFVVGWVRLLKDLGVRMSFWPAARMYLVSNFGRYLPGAKAWQMGIVGVMAAEAGLPGALVAGTSLLQGVIGVLVGGILLLGTGGAALGIAPAWFAVPVVGIITVLALPALLRKVPAVWSLAVKKIPGVESVTAGTMWTIVWTTAASWVAWGLALRALAQGLLGDPGASVAAYIAAWIGPFLAGVLAFVSPAGLGVREGTMQMMLSAAGLASSAGLVLIVVARVWATLLDVVPALVVLAIRRRRRPAPVS